MDHEGSENRKVQCSQAGNVERHDGQHEHLSKSMQAREQLKNDEKWK